MGFGLLTTLMGTSMWNQYQKEAKAVGMTPTYSGYLKYVENRIGIAPIKIENDQSRE